MVAQERSMRVPWGDGGWRRVLVYGLGISGRAAARLLLERGVEVVGADRRPPGELALEGLAGRPGFELLPAAPGGGEPRELPAGIDGVVLSPGVPPDRPLLTRARERGLPVIAEVELAFQFARGPVVGITGSNGKSTTTALTGAMVAAGGRAVEVCGNIGSPFADRVDGPPGRTFVVELSSFQLEGIDSFRPRAAALLNLAADHLDRYPGFAEYAAAKGRLLERVDPDGVAVLNADDPRAAGAASPARRRFFSRLAAVDDGCYLASDRVLEVAPGAAPRELFRPADVPVAGVHNLENAMASALLALAVGTEAEALKRGLVAFEGLPHRLQKVARQGEVTWYDDSKGTNPAATAKSLAGFPDASVHLILGGRSKGLDPADLVPAVAAKARRVYLIGEAAAELEAALGEAAPCRVVGTLAAAVEAAGGAARAGEAVVLSPACASFDQFRDFAHRGDAFQELVRRHLAPPTPGGAHGQEAGL